MTRTVRIAVAMNTRVAAMERGEPRPIPQTPCPLVQPAPSRVPNPTIRPATTRRPSDCVRSTGGRDPPKRDVGERRHEKARQEREPPADFAPRGVDQAAEDAADARDTPVEHEEQAQQTRRSERLQ